MMADLERSATGVAGLDEMLHGGLVPGSIALLQGAPGTGKTTLGVQFLVEGARIGEPGLLVSFEQFPHTLHRDAESHGWDLPALEREGRLRVVFTSPEVLVASLQSPTSPISSAIRELGVKRAVLDSMTHLQTITRDPVELRSQHGSLINGLRREGITSLLLSEDSGPDFVRSDRGRLAFAVDAVILLRYVEIDSVMNRAVAVLKMRGSDHDKTIRGFEIERGGIQVQGAFVGREGLLSGTPRRAG